MLERFSALVHTIYEGSIDPGAWPRIVGAVAGQVDAEKGLLVTPFTPGAAGFTFAHAISPAEVARWSSRCQAEGVWAKRLAERNFAREGTVVFGHELVTDAELSASPWYREFLSPLNIFRMVTAIVFGADDPRAPPTCVSFFRGPDAPPFDEHHRQLLRELVPHFARSLGTMFKLREADSRRAASLHALMKVRHGVLLLDAKGAVQFANEAAERIFSRQDGLRLAWDAEAPRLIADHPIDRAVLEQALRSNLTDASNCNQTVLVRRIHVNASYAVQISHLSAANPLHFGSVHPHSVVFIKDDSLASRLDAELLQDVYGLTQTEARAAAALCDGDRLEAVAAQLNVSLNTLKTHLKSIYVKTSVDNRAALTKLLVSLA